MSAPLAGIQELDYRGERYVLGRGLGIYAIWDLHAGGQPIRTFPLSEEGWQGAWLEFRELEGPGAADVQRISGSVTALQPLRAGQIVGRSVALWWRNLGILMAISALVLIPIEGILSTLTLLNLRQVPVVLGERTTQVYQTEPWVQIVDAIVRVVVISPLLTGSVLVAAATIILGRRASVRVAYRVALRKAASVLWVVILEVLAFLAALVPGVTLALVVGQVLGSGSGSSSSGVALAITLLAVLALPPGIFVILRLIYAPAIVVVEDIRGMAALRRSWDLVRGMTWKVLGTIVLAGLVGIAIGLPFGIILVVVYTTGLSPHSIFVGATIFGVALQILVMPIGSLANTLLYVDARVRREAFDREDLARELAEAGA